MPKEVASIVEWQTGRAGSVGVSVQVSNRQLTVSPLLKASSAERVPVVPLVISFLGEGLLERTDWQSAATVASKLAAKAVLWLLVQAIPYVKMSPVVTAHALVLTVMVPSLLFESQPAVPTAFRVHVNAQLTGSEFVNASSCLTNPESPRRMFYFWTPLDVNALLQSASTSMETSGFTRVMWLFEQLKS